jgi:TonB family protein
MKKILITPLLLLLFIAGFSQNLDYGVHGKYLHPIKKETLEKAKFMADLIPYYPVWWIAGYESVEILATCDGKAMMASGANDTLSTEQRNILSKAELGTDIILNIKFKSKNAVTDNIETGTMNYSATVIPETEAEYPGGNQQMTQYLKENAIDKIPEISSKQIQQTLVEFTVNEKGETANAKIIKTSGDSETDKLLIEAINKMPKWSPAKDSKGRKVKQEFEFSVGSSGC